VNTVPKCLAVLLSVCLACLFAAPSNAIFQSVGKVAVFSVLVPSGDGEEEDRCFWRTDGTPAGTFPLGLCIRPTDVISGSEGLLRLGDRLLLRVARLYEDDELFTMDGTVAGSQRLLAAPRVRGVAVWHGDEPFELLLAGQGADLQPWITDGTTQGTIRLAEAAPAPLAVALDAVMLDERRLLFLTAGSPGPDRLWRFDLETLETTPLTDFPAAPERVFRLDAEHAAGGAVVFWRPTERYREALWRSDGTPGGTYPLMETAPTPERRRLDRVEDRVFFRAADEAGRALWWTDGTAVHRVGPLPAGFTENPDYLGLVAAGGNLFFLETDDGASGTELWVSSLTEGGTRVLDLCPGPCSSWPSNPYEQNKLAGRPRLPRLVVGGELVVPRSDPQYGHELWISDGTVAGSRVLADLCPGACSSSPSDPPLLAGGGVFTTAGDGAHGRELWRLDPAGGEAIRITDFAPTAGPGGLGTVGDAVLFFADDGRTGFELWSSDGTASGTRLLTDLQPDTPPPPPPAAAPAPPQPQSVQSGGEMSAELSWTPSAGAAEYVIEARTPVDDAWVALAATTDPFAAVLGLRPDTPYELRVRARNGAGVSAPGAAVTTGTLPSSLPQTCAAATDVLCLADGRFRVKVHWRNARAQDPRYRHGVAGALAAADGSDRSGYFWFFRPDNVELVVKMLDGGDLNASFWVFRGGLSDVEHWLSVVDLRAWPGDGPGAALRTYHNPQGEICGGADTGAFPSFGVEPPAASVAAAPIPAAAAAARATAATHPPETCVEDGTTLCLLDGRFRVRVEWRDQHNGGAGVGGALPFSDRTGFFWFFKRDNVELVVKVLDGTPVNGKVWVFWGALTDVGYTLSVTDVLTGHDVRRYVNAPGNLCGGADTAAF
jgi:ELWxxDGT repeat protein